MDPSDAIQVLVLLALIGLSAFFSSAETALVTVNKIRIRNLIDEGDRRALILSKLVEDQGKMLSAILIGNNIVNISASSLSTILVTRWLAGTGLAAFAAGISTGVLTLTVLVFGEITPKTCATIHSEKIALSYARIVYTWMIVATPLIYVMNNLSMGILFLMRVDPNDKSETYTEEEIRTIVEVSHEEGVIQMEEKKMITNVFDFGENLAKDIMVPRIDMTFINVDATYDELLETFREEKYTRFPVYEESTDNVIGIINVKDLLLLEGKENFSIRDFLRQPLYTYEFKKAAELMVEMRKTLNNIVIVLDEYGATAGLITLEDMLEEIVGEIRDEYDEDEEESVVEIEPGQYRVNASLKLDDLNEYLNLKLESEDYDSLGGLVIGLLDHLPEEGEEVTHKGLRMVVEHMDKNRIETILLYLLEEDEEGGEQEEEAVEEEARRA